MGLSFKRASSNPPADFSLGVYAPNSSDGKTNSVRLNAGSDASRVSQEATQSNNAEDHVAVGVTGTMFTAKGKRQDAYGARNYILGEFVPA